MTRPDLFKKLNDMFDQMQRERSFGNIAIAFRDGEPDLIRKETTEKISQGSNPNVKTYR